jgi:hypothetical protein
LLIGFVLLTLAVGSGLFFSEELFGKPMSIDHKTLFAFASGVSLPRCSLAGTPGAGAGNGPCAGRWPALLCSSWPTSVAASSLKSFSVAFEPWMTSPVGTFADAGSSVSHVRLFLAQRDGDDGLQSLSPAPPGTIRPPWRPKALRCWRVPTRCWASSCSATISSIRLPPRWSVSSPSRCSGGQMGSRCRHPGCHLRHPGLFRNHPEIIGATYADRLAVVLGYILTPAASFIRLSGSSTCLPAFSSKYCTYPRNRG